MNEGATKDEALSRLECVESKFSAVCLAEFTPRAWVTPFGGGSCEGKKIGDRSR